MLKLTLLDIQNSYHIAIIGLVRINLKISTSLNMATRNNSKIFHKILINFGRKKFKKQPKIVFSSLEILNELN
jgi:hypothetical protein